MENKKIKVLHIFSGVGGGISTWIKKAAIFSEGKYVIDAMAFAISNKAKFVEIIEKNGGSCYEMPRIKKGVITLIIFIIKLIKKNNYDVIHCHIDGYAAIPIWFSVNLICRKKVIIHSHRTSIEKISEKKYANIIYVVNKVVNKLIAKNKVACGKKAASFAFGKSKDVKILYNGINPISNDIQTNIFINDNDIINIVALGRLNRVKNHNYMIQIAKVLKKMGTIFHLYIVGDGELKGTLAAKIREQHLESFVSLEGYCNTPEIYLNKCDVFIMPSFSEGLPTVILEAQEHGCGILVSDVITHECDLEFGLITYLGIDVKNITSWAKYITEHKKKKIYIPKESFNNRLDEKGFLNKKIYKEYFEYLKSI